MTLDNTRARRLILAAAAAALALRLAFGFLYWVDKPLTHDEHEYLALARGVASPARVKVAQSLVGALTVWLIGLIALYGAGPRAGVWAAGLAAAYPPLVSMPSYALSETFYSAVALATAFVLQLAVDRTRDDQITGAGRGRATGF